MQFCRELFIINDTCAGIARKASLSIVEEMFSTPEDFIVFINILAELNNFFFCGENISYDIIRKLAVIAPWRIEVFS